MTSGRKVYEKIKAYGKSAVFFDEISQQYLTGFYSTDGLVTVCAEGTFLVVDSRYIEAAGRAKAEGTIYDDVEVKLLDKGVFDAVIKYTPEGETVFDSTAVTVDRLEKATQKTGRKFVPIADICGEFRQIKTEAEIKSIETAQQITDAAFAHILEFIREGITERDVAAELEFFMKKNGSEAPAFETIAVSGVNSSLPHGVPSDKLLSVNSFLTMDFGAKYGGYCSDMTRTVVLGRADDEMKQVYETVYKAQKAGIKAAFGGVRGCDADKAARDVINAAGYGDRFGHSLGHSLGLEIHESPRFSPSFSGICPENAVITVEPGIYIESKYGVRIEDMVLLTASGNRNLTHSPKNLIEI